MKKLYSHPLLIFYKRFIGEYAVLLIFILISALLLYSNKHNPEGFNTFRLSVLRLIHPILESVSGPLVWVSQSTHKFTDLMSQQEELNALREQNTKLLKWQAIGKQLKYENTVLRSLLKLAPSPKTYFITAQVIASSAGAFSHTLLINAGSQHGLRPDQVVTTHRGLVGRIVRVAPETSQVLLIHDINMRIPAALESSRARVIVAGKNSSLMDALYFPKNEKITLGERVVSSFEGGIFPPNIVIGKIVSVNEHSVKIKSLVNWEDLEFVQVLQQVSTQEIDEHAKN